MSKNIFRVPYPLIDLIESLVPEQTLFAKPKTFREKMLYIGSTIYEGQLRGQLKDEEEFKRLNINTLANIIGCSTQKTSTLLAAFTESGLVSKVSDSVVGFQSCGYAFNCDLSTYFRGEVSEIVSSKVKKNALNTNNNFLKLIKTQFKYLKLDMDWKGGIINQVHNSNYSGHQVDSHLYAIDIFNEDEAYVRRPIANSRIYTPLTSLPKVYLGALTYKGTPCNWEIDMCQGQPTLMILRYRAAIKTMKESSFKDKCLQELEAYTQEVYNNTHYSQLMEIGGYTPDQRDDFKEHYFEEILYGRNPTKLSVEEQELRQREYKRLTKMRKAYIAKFPTLWRVLEQMKAKDYKELPKQLQKKEAEIIINTVLKQCLAMKIPAFTRHDSIMTTEEHVQTIKGLLEDSFVKYNITPQLTIKQH